MKQNFRNEPEEHADCTESSCCFCEPAIHPKPIAPKDQVQFTEPPALYHEQTRCEAICHILSHKAMHFFLHWHDNIEIAASLNYPSSFLIDGVIHQAEPGDLIVIAPSVTHQFRTLHDNTRYVVCQLSSRNLQTFGMTPAMVKPFIPREEIRRDTALCDKIDTLLDWMNTETASSADAPNPVIQALAVSLYCLLARSFPETDKLRVNQSEQKEFHTVFRYVNDHILEDLTVSGIAKSLYYTRSKLTALFAKYAGISLSDYIRELRIDMAKRHLANGATITKAALESGFQNVRTFNNNFRAVVGMAPSEYVRQLKL